MVTTRSPFCGHNTIQLNGKDLSCYSNKIDSVSLRKVWSLSYQQSVFKRCHSDKHFSEFLPARWRQKSTGIDVERKYATVSLCIEQQNYYEVREGAVESQNCVRKRLTKKECFKTLTKDSVINVTVDIE